MSGTRLPLESIPGLDLTVAMDHLMDMRDLLEDVLIQMASGELADTPDVVGRLYREGDVVTAERTAHSLKSVAGMVGATEVESRAATLEAALRERARDIDIEQARVELDEVLRPLITAIRAGIRDEAEASTEEGG